MANIYVHGGNGTSTGYYAVAQWASGTVYSASTNGGRGDYVRQLAAPAVGSERVFRCTTAGTSGGSEPAWTLTKNGTTSDNTAGWTECTGQEADQVSGNWKAPHARALNAMAATWSTAGDVYLKASVDTAGDTQAAALTLLSPGTVTNPCKMLCVNASGSVPPVSADLTTGAVIAASGNNSINFGGHCYVEGITFSAGSSTNAGSINIPTSTTTSSLRTKNVKLILNNSNAASVISIGNGSNTAELVEMINTTMKFGSTSQSAKINGGNVIWRDTPSGAVDPAGSIPTSLFLGATNNANFYGDGLDLSAFVTGKTLVGANPGATKYYLNNCKTGAGVTIAAAQAAPGSAEVYLTRTDDGTKYYRQEKASYLGAETVETTIVRTGGAADGATNTAIAKKLVSGAGAKPEQPFSAIPIAVWNAVTAADRTITVYGIWGGGAVPTNDDVWMTVSYNGSATTPQSSLVSTAKADVLATAAAVASDGSTWGGSTTAFKLVATLNAPQPQQKGLIYVTIKIGTASTTVYIDPAVVLS